MRCSLLMVFFCCINLYCCINASRSCPQWVEECTSFECMLQVEGIFEGCTDHGKYHSVNTRIKTCLSTLSGKTDRKNTGIFNTHFIRVCNARNTCILVCVLLLAVYLGYIL